jgi:polysaccharide deacetylase family protein (PEP-CTERM system associated)
MNRTILLTFDVEDWFQVENFKQYIPFSSWSSCELRVEKNVHRILDLLDSINCNTDAQNHRSTSSSLINNSKPETRNNGFDSPPHTSRLAPHERDSLCSMPALRKVSVGGRSAPYDLSSSPYASHLAPHGSIKGTFFILGWLAERLPHLVREIQTRDHEVASHGYNHKLCREQSAHELRVDLVKSKELLEDITGTPIYGYRAPSFSVADDILKVVEDSGYLYDSSFNSFKLNKRYGQVDLGTNNGSNGLSIQISDRFYELPISNLRIGKQIIPWGGGGYFRLIPSQLFKYGVQSILKNQGAYLFYLHPWEIDREQPIVSKAPKSLKLRHYLNLNNTYSKLFSMLDCFKHCRFLTLVEYINCETQQTQ